MRNINIQIYISIYQPHAVHEPNFLFDHSGPDRARSLWWWLIHKVPAQTNALPKIKLRLNTKHSALARQILKPGWSPTHTHMQPSAQEISQSARRDVDWSGFACCAFRICANIDIFIYDIWSAQRTKYIVHVRGEHKYLFTIWSAQHSSQRALRAESSGIGQLKHAHVIRVKQDEMRGHVSTYCCLTKH